MNDTPTPRVDAFAREKHDAAYSQLLVLASQIEIRLGEQERDLSECRAALAERQAAIDEIVACKDATDELSIRHGGEWYTASYANEAKAVTDRKEALWPALRALATKEPQ